MHVTKRVTTRTSRPPDAVLRSRSRHLRPPRPSTSRNEHQEQHSFPLQGMDLTAHERYRKPSEGAMTMEERGIVSSAEILIPPARSLSVTFGYSRGTGIPQGCRRCCDSFRPRERRDKHHSFVRLSPWTCGSWESKGTLELDPLGLVLAARYI